MCAEDPFLQPLRGELHQGRDLALLVQPPAEGIQRPDPAVARDGPDAALAEMNDEPLEVRLADQRCGLGP
jgi:hypothetical protein